MRHPVSAGLPCRMDLEGVVVKYVSFRQRCVSCGESELVPLRNPVMPVADCLDG